MFPKKYVRKEAEEGIQRSTQKMQAAHITKGPH